MENEAQPMIERQYKVKIPNGEIYTAFVFDFNLAWATDGLIQLSNNGWIKARSCEVVQ